MCGKLVIYGSSYLRLQAQFNEPRRNLGPFSWEPQWMTEEKNPMATVILNGSNWGETSGKLDTYLLGIGPCLPGTSWREPSHRTDLEGWVSASQTLLGAVPTFTCGLLSARWGWRAEKWCPILVKNCQQSCLKWLYLFRGNYYFFPRVILVWKSIFESIHYYRIKMAFMIIELTSFILY